MHSRIPVFTDIHRSTFTASRYAKLFSNSEPTQPGALSPGVPLLTDGRVTPHREVPSDCLRLPEQKGGGEMKTIDVKSLIIGVLVSVVVVIGVAASTTNVQTAGRS